MNKLLKIIAASIAVFSFSCSIDRPGHEEPKSTSGAIKATVKVPTNASGLTTEQENVSRRLVEDNEPGAIKHVYVISAYSGQVVLYSTAKGKVSSSGKRLSPTSVVYVNPPGTSSWYSPFQIEVGGEYKMTNEVLGDDGTYGSSSEYLYWWDVRGVYHQHYVSGGQIFHVSSKPIAVKSIVLNLETNEQTPVDNKDQKDK